MKQKFQYDETGVKLECVKKDITSVGAKSVRLNSSTDAFRGRLTLPLPVCEKE